MNRNYYKYHLTFGNYFLKKLHLGFSNVILKNKDIVKLKFNTLSIII